jgi:hypothetical protein
MNLVFTDVETPQVHCQRHIYVYPFVYHQIYTNTQLQSPAINRGPGCLLLCLIVTGSVGVHFQRGVNTH